MTIRIALGLEYDGSMFVGWQQQASGTSVQSVVEQALSHVAAESIRIVCAGRTDAGVHALNQVIHFDSKVKREEKAWVYGANTHLRPSVRIQWAKPVDAAFHARYSAVEREYRYYIFCSKVKPALARNLVTWCYRELDVALMQQAAQCLVGQHDFSSFRSAQCQAKSPIRQVSVCEFSQQGAFICFTIKANAFLHHMIRNIMGALLQIGMHKRPTSWLGELLVARDLQANPYMAGINFSNQLIQLILSH